MALAANGGVATASSTYSLSYPANATNNGDRKGLNWGSGGGWNDAAPGNTFPDWLQVDFNGSKTISEIDVFTIQDNYPSPVEPTETMTFSTYGLTAYDVQYWNGSAWMTVPGGSITGNNKVWRKFTFSPIATTKIRVLTNASVDGYSRLVELEAWSTGATSQNVTWTNVSSTIQVTGNSIQKTSGTNAWDAGAISTQTIASGDGSVEFTLGEIQTWRMCGLGNGDTTTYYTDIEYAIFIDGGAGLHIYESGNYRGAFGAYAAGDRLKVAVENGVVKYYRNSTLLYSSTVAPQYPLLVDTSLNTVNAGVYNVVLNSSAPAGWNLNWVVGDHLGTPRMVFDKSGTLAATKRHDYLPFGEELTTQSQRTAQMGYTADTVRQKFTSYERDSETQLDYAHARYYASFQGRFTGVDRVSGTPADPQSWNGYSYTHNNPLNLTDPTGMIVSAEYGYDPGRESDPYLWESRMRRVTTDDIERVSGCISADGRSRTCQPETQAQTEERSGGKKESRESMWMHASNQGKSRREFVARRSIKVSLS
ncbi:MAG: RHS repeat-associated core domain-containing protein [Pyrinomonadaceae bacterium]